MADETKKQDPKQVTVSQKTVDEFAAQVFESMGYDPKNLPESLVVVYQEMKIRKDRIFPGNLSPDWFAFCAFMSSMIDGKIDFGKKE